jgi:molybdopterin-binding protein
MAGRADLVTGLTNVLRLVRDPSGALAIADGGAPGQVVHVLDASRERRETLVAIRPEDIALARGHVPATSIRNQLRARVMRRAEHAGGILVEMDVGQPLLVQITGEAARELDVRPGAELCCLVKSTAIRSL